MDNTYKYLYRGSMKYKGIIKKVMDFLSKEQLKNKDLWKKFVDVYRNNSDDKDNGWKCEYWGKMMRGACYCYKYDSGKILYRVLKATVEDMLSAQEDDGRYSSYSKEKEFTSWDMWGRKYIMTSMISFYKVSRETEFKEKILKALCRHADYIMDHVGKGEGKINITDTSSWWLGVNSSSILETFVDLYRISKKDKYLEYAKYIVEEGGIRDGNLIEICKEGKLLPYQYPEAKAYETMSFFEGVMEYAKEVNDNELLSVAIKFFKDVENSEISIIGNAGSFEENFSNASIHQTEKPEKFMQETCVVITWMRILSKLHLLTGDVHYYELFSQAALNCYIGSVNFYQQSSYDWWGKKTCEPLPFDSYSPLYNDRRGVSTGGLQYLDDGSIYGCCACIGSIGVGLMGLNTFLNNENDNNEIIINDYYEGRVSLITSYFRFEGNYLIDGKAKITIKSKKKLNIKLRIPSWSNNPKVKVNNIIYDVKEGTYFSLTLNDNVTVVELSFNPSIRLNILNNKVAYSYGPLVLALSEEDNANLKLDEVKADKISNFELTSSPLKEFVAFKATYGVRKKIIFKDYASSAKKWDKPHNKLTVWINQ